MLCTSYPFICRGGVYSVTIANIIRRFQHPMA